MPTLGKFLVYSSMWHIIHLSSVPPFLFFIFFFNFILELIQVISTQSTYKMLRIYVYQSKVFLLLLLSMFTCVTFWQNITLCINLSNITSQLILYGKLNWSPKRSILLPFEKSTVDTDSKVNYTGDWNIYVITNMDGTRALVSFCFFFD